MKSDGTLENAMWSRRQTEKTWDCWIGKHNVAVMFSVTTCKRKAKHIVGLTIGIDNGLWISLILDDTVRQLTIAVRKT